MPAVERSVLEQAEAADTRVVDPNVNPTIALDRAIGQELHFFFDCHVRDDDDGFARTQTRARSFLQRLRAACGEHQICSGACEFNSRSATEPAGRPGDDDDSTAETTHRPTVSIGRACSLGFSRIGQLLAAARLFGRVRELKGGRISLHAAAASQAARG